MKKDYAYMYFMVHPLMTVHSPAMFLTGEGRKKQEEEEEASRRRHHESSVFVQGKLASSSFHLEPRWRWGEKGRKKRESFHLSQLRHHSSLCGGGWELKRGKQEKKRETSPFHPQWQGDDEDDVKERIATKWVPLKRLMWKKRTWWQRVEQAASHVQVLEW